MVGYGEEGLKHGTKASMWVDGECEWDEDHVFVVEFSNDVVTVDHKGGGGGVWLVHTPKFVTFMTLKVVVCIGSDGVEDVFSGDRLGWRGWARDVYVGPDGCVRADGYCTIPFYFGEVQVDDSLQLTLEERFVKRRPHPASIMGTVLC